MNRNDLKMWITKNFLVSANELIKMNYSPKVLRKKFGAEIVDALFLETAFLSDCKISEKFYCILHDVFERKKCKNCDNFVTYECFRRGYFAHCSKTCGLNDPSVSEKVRLHFYLKNGNGTYGPLGDKEVLARKDQTTIDRFGTISVLTLPSIQEKYKRTCLKNLGVDSPRKNKDVVAKANASYKRNCLAKTGYDNYWKVPAVREKIRQTNLRERGVENVFSADDVKRKLKKTNLQNCGKENVSQAHLTDEQLRLLNDKAFIENEYLVNKKPFHVISREIGVSDTVVSHYAKKLGIEVLVRYRSYGEEEIARFIGEFNMLCNKKGVIPARELDLYLPEKSFAIEYNGDFWHSINCSPDYHLSKTLACEEKGIQLFHIFQSEWEDPTKQLIWKSLINGKLGRNKWIEAETIQEVPDSCAFLEQNHLEGFTESKVNLGMFQGDELVSLACFSDGQLLRHCDKVGFQVKDSLELIMTAYNQPITYLANRRWNSFFGLECTEPQKYLWKNFVNWDCGSWICEWEPS